MKLQTLLENQSTGTEFFKSREEIEAWLKECNVGNYEIHEDLTVTLNDDLELSFWRLQSIPIKFRKTKSIDVSHNQLTRIDWAPEVVDGFFNCNNNFLKSLDGGPKKVHGHFEIDTNAVYNLVGGPEEVNGFYICSNTNLTNLEGVAKTVQGHLDATNCRINSLEFLPETIKGGLFLDDNKITSLRGIYKVLKLFNGSTFKGSISLTGNPIEKGMISVMGIKGFSMIVYDDDAEGVDRAIVEDILKVKNIINNSVKNNIDAITTQKLLADAGLMKYS